MEAYTEELRIQGKVERFANNPSGQCLRLVDGKVVWTLDKLSGDFENDGVCVTVKRVRLECGDKEFA